MNRTPSMRRRYEAAQQDRWIFPILACAALSVLLFIDGGEEIEPAVTSQAHREWVAELCSRTTDEAALKQCAKFLEGR